MKSIPTIEVKFKYGDKKGTGFINECDFDAKKHTKVSEKEEPKSVSKKSSSK